MQAVVLYTVAFITYSVMAVLGLMPQELISAGVTLPQICSWYYGDPGIDFTSYQLKRTTCSVAIHSLLPIMYCIGLTLFSSSSMVFNPWQSSSHLFELILWVLSGVVLCVGLSLSLIWRYNDWQRHPFSQQLSKLGRNWRLVAQIVNLEFRSIDKFLSQLGGSTVIVTNSWIIKSNVHSVNIIHQRDAVLNVSGSDEHTVSMDGRSSQYLTINVMSLNSLFDSFNIRLNSLQYSQLKDKVQSPIRIARRTVIHESLSDMFLSAFEQQVQRNDTYPLQPGQPALELCAGCLQKIAEVKLQKMCSPLNEGRCQQCFCPPMWCISCLSKWFEARQDKHNPDSWMASTAPCPMCRATFCVLDVLKVQN